MKVSRKRKRKDALHSKIINWDKVVADNIAEGLWEMQKTLAINMWFPGKALVDGNIPAMIILRKIVPFWRKAEDSKWWIGKKYWNFRADREARKCLN